jgi:hypothetical protein
MLQNKPPPTRFVGLDVHQHYLIAIGVDVELDQVWGPQLVQLDRLGLAADLAAIQWGKRRIALPPSQLVSADL